MARVCDKIYDLTKNARIYLKVTVYVIGEI
jgi:hypothetical protein